MSDPTEDLIARLEAPIVLHGVKDYPDEAMVAVLVHCQEQKIEAAQALRALQQEVDVAVAWVRELSDELAGEIEGRYDCLLPQLQHRFDRDMTTVEDARAYLAARSALTGSAQG